MADDLIRCSRCQRDLDPDAFTPSHRKQGDWCRTCRRDYQRDYLAQHPDKAADYRRTRAARQAAQPRPAPAPRPSIAERLDAGRVEQPDGCWLWSGTHDKRGRPVISHDGRTRKVARVAWTLYRQPLDDSTVVRHLCASGPACWNPKHMTTTTVRRTRRVWPGVVTLRTDDPAPARSDD
jgi:hypothetical protein